MWLWSVLVGNVQSCVVWILWITTKNKRCRRCRGQKRGGWVGFGLFKPGSEDAAGNAEFEFEFEFEFELLLGQWR